MRGHMSCERRCFPGGDHASRNTRAYWSGGPGQVRSPLYSVAGVAGRGVRRHPAGLASHWPSWTASASGCCAARTSCPLPPRRRLPGQAPSAGHVDRIVPANWTVPRRRRQAGRLSGSRCAPQHSSFKSVSACALTTTRQSFSDNRKAGGMRSRRSATAGVRHSETRGSSSARCSACRRSSSVVAQWRVVPMTSCGLVDAWRASYTVATVEP
jgi:hypothetical protein